MAGRNASLATAAVAASLLAAPATAGAARTPRPHFSFLAIEFAPADQRLPAARRYLRETAAPGTPLAAAIAAMRRAEAACARRPEADGAIRCRYSRVASDSALDMPLGDVTWTVRLYPSTDGRIVSATVERQRVGQ